MNVLLNAKEDLLKNGLNKDQHYYEADPTFTWGPNHRQAPQTGAACMLGAICRANNMTINEAYNHPAYRIMNQVIHEQFPDRGQFVPWFNDHEDTTLEDAIAVLEKAAVILDERP